MNVLLLGATGLIGEAVLRRLMVAGHRITAPGRDLAAVRRRWPEVEWIAHDIAGLRTPADWAPLLAGIEAVVNCAGALQDGARDDVAAIHAAAPRALFTACAEAGIGRIVHVSAVGAAPDADTPFMRSKGEAEAALEAMPGAWVILRPGLVLGPTAYGGSALLRALASVPLVLPVVRGEARIQTVHVDDLAEAVRMALDGALPPHARYDLVESQSHSLTGILGALRAWQGWPPGRLLRLPEALARPVIVLADGLGRLGWRSPLRSAAWAELGRGVAGDPAPFVTATGGPPRDLAETLRDLPVGVQERWFARMWLLKPLVLGGLAAFWIVSGLLGLVSFGAARDVLMSRGMAPGLAAIFVAAGAAIDLLVGAGMLVRRWVRPAALGMIATTLAYLAAGSVVAPDLWADPLGPYVKTIPAMILAMVALAVAPER